MKILSDRNNWLHWKRLLSVLLDQGHEVVCCVRDKNRFDESLYPDSKISVIEVDFLKESTLQNIPNDIDVAYYLIHSMSAAVGDFESLETISAKNFLGWTRNCDLKQVIYLSGISNDSELSKHLTSRRNVEEVLSSGQFHLTTLRAGIIVGSGSASFEIMRDLVEKLPIMIAPKWLNTKSQPIAIRNVLDFLLGVLMNDKTFDQSFDIGGPAVLTYKKMLLQFAEVRGLKRIVISVPVMTPKLSSYWLYFVTSTSYKLAVNLVDSMKVEVVARDNQLEKMLGLTLLTYQEAVQLAFDKIAQQEVLSSWTDAQSSKILSRGISKLIEVPTYGCFTDKRRTAINDENAVLNRIWRIGGKTGWYYGNWLWEIRGFLDKIVGGVGLRRGRKSASQISAGDALDFWRVLFADKGEKRLLLYAEMKLPGEAWLEFQIKNNQLYQTATFRPLGIWGRFYWYAVLPFHGLIFNGMMDRIAVGRKDY